GRSAEMYGEDGVWADRLNHTLELTRLAREEYRRLDPKMRSIVDGFATGINHYLKRHPGVHPRLLTRIEPWYPLAFIRYNYFQNRFAFGAGIRFNEIREGPRGPSANQGSNGWVVSPSRSASGHALLLINPPLPFFGPGQVYEGHLHSEEVWNFTGYA